MSSAECLRDLISERLTAAAEEIFRAFQATIIKYEEEIDRQSRLLELVLKPEIQFQMAELQHQNVSKDEEGLAVHQLCNQDRNSTLDQDDPQPPQIKEENEEFYTSLVGEQLALKRETETFMLAPTCEENDISDDQSVDLSPNKIQRAAGKEHAVVISVKGRVEPEAKSDVQLLCHSSHGAESRDCKGGEHGESGATGNAEHQPRHQEIKNHPINEDDSSTLTITGDTYTGKKCVKCDTCGKSFQYKSKLHVHMRVHTGEKPYHCNICEKRFSKVGELRLHTRVHTGVKPYPCNTCEKRFSKLGTLKVHMRVHTGEKPYPCNICEKRFSHRDTLKKHIRSHTGEKPYPCNTCEKSFSHLETLKMHVRKHTGEKPYPCNTCDKRFSELGTLKVHMRTHTGEKPYPCNTCEKRFSKQGTLKVHMRVHTGEKPYPCHTCGKRFSHGDTLKKHMRIHTGEKPYPCNTCQKGFSELSTLKVHMSTHR